MRAGRKEVTGAASLAEVGDFSALAADLDDADPSLPTRRRKSALAEYLNASKQAQEVRSMKSADYNVDFRDPSKVKKREEKTASSHRVSAGEIEGGEFAAARAARDERKLARKADVPRTRYHLAIHFRFPPNRTWLWKCATAPSRIPPLSKILQEFSESATREKA